MSERAQLLRELEAQLRGRDPGFGEILDALAEAVTIRDSHHHILYANRAAIESMGFSSLEDMQRHPPHSIFADYIVQGEHGEELTMDAVPSVRLLAGEPAEPLVMRTINRSTGELKWQLLKAAPLHDADGQPVAAVTIIEDITRERIAELHDRFLARATETLMSSLDYEETLRNVAWLAVPEIADWCVIELVDDRGSRQRVVVAHRDPSKLELAERLRQFEPEELSPERGVGRILHTGASELYQDIPDEALAAAAVDDEHLTLLLLARVPLGDSRAADRARADLRRHDAGHRGVDAPVRGRRPRVRRATGGTSRGRGRQLEARHRPPSDRATRSSGASSPTRSRRSRDGTSPRSTAPLAPPRRSRSEATSTTSTRTATAGSCCSATSPARASRRPR